MNCNFRIAIYAPLLLAWTLVSAPAESRMQVSATSSALYSQPSGAAQQVGRAAHGEILFVSRTDGDWVGIAPPDYIDLWLNKDFVESNRVLARSIQVRSGPGIQYDVVGTLERGAPVMPRGEDGEWAKIAPPSSATLWVKQADLTTVRARTETPIREVVSAPVPVPAPEPTPAPEPSLKPQPVFQPQAEPAPSSEPDVIPTVVAAAPPEAPPAPVIESPRPTARIAPSTPYATTAQPEAIKPPRHSSPPPAPVAPRPVLRPATALPAPSPTPLPAITPPPHSVPQPSTPPRVIAPPPRAGTPPSTLSPQRPVHRTPTTVPAPATTVTAQRSADIEVAVDPNLVEDLELIEAPQQGKPVQVEGELRAAPFLAASPSRYRLLAYDGDILEMVCHVHGNSVELRRYIGKNISIRGREYWVEKSDMPVVVVGQIVPLTPNPVHEPVLF